MFSVQSSVLSAQLSAFSVQCRVFSAQCLVFSVKCSVPSAQFSVFSGQCFSDFDISEISAIFGISKISEILEMRDANANEARPHASFFIVPRRAVAFVPVATRSCSSRFSLIFLWQFRASRFQFSCCYLFSRFVFSNYPFLFVCFNPASMRSAWAWNCVHR